MAAKQFLIQTIFQGIDNMTTPVQGIKTSVDAMKQGMKGLDRIVRNVAMGIAAVAGTATSAILKSVNEAAKIEQSIVKLSTKLEGGINQSKRLVDEILILAANTPLQFENLTKNADVLLAYGVSSNDLLDTLRQLGDVAQGSSEKLDGIVGAYGRIIAEDRVTRKRLTPFVTGGVPIYEALAQSMGVTRNELSKLIQAGRVGSIELTNALAGLTSEGGMFFQNMEKQSKTLFGRWSTFKDNIKITAATLGNIFLPAAKDVLDYLIVQLDAVTIYLKETFGESWGLDEFGNEIAILNPNLLRLQDGLKGTIDWLKELLPKLPQVFGEIKSGAKWVFNLIETIKIWSQVSAPVIVLLGSIYLGMKLFIGVATTYTALVSAIGVAKIILTTIMGGFSAAIGIASTAVGIFNAIIAANPISLVILAVVALIAIFVVLYNTCEPVRNIINYVWDSFVALGVLIKDTFISQIQNLINIWNNVIACFKNGDILGAILAIGGGIVSSLLNPVEGLLGLLSRLPGKAGEMAKSAKSAVSGFSDKLSGTVTTQVENKQQTTSGNIDVNFNNAPQGTQVESSGKALGSVSLNTGRARGSQR